MELRTARLRLRPYREADFETLFTELILDPVVTGLWPDYMDPALTVADKRAMAEHDLGSWIAEGIAAGYPTWMLEAADPALGPPGDFVGAAGLFPPQNEWGPEPEVGCLLASRHHGRGLATEALSAVIADATERLAIPVLTEERRKELTKICKKHGEDTKVHIRGFRRDANEELKKLQKDAKLTEDELRKAEQETQKLTEQCGQKIDDVIKKKEQEILEV